MVTKVTLEEIEEFILAQDDDKPIDFKNIKNNDDCGCLMIDYGQAAGFEFEDVGTNCWFDNVWPIAEAVDWRYNTWSIQHETYKTLKEAVLAKRRKA